MGEHRAGLGFPRAKPASQSGLAHSKPPHHSHRRAFSTTFNPQSIHIFQRPQHRSCHPSATMAVDRTPTEAKPARSGIARGLNRGHVVTPRAVPKRVSKSKGHLSKRTAFVREIVKEVAGYVSPHSLSLIWMSGCSRMRVIRDETCEPS